jgi:hypothetical protein
MVSTVLGVLHISLVLVLSSLFFHDRFPLLLLYSSLSLGYGLHLLHCIVRFLCTFPSLYSLID